MNLAQINMDHDYERLKQVKSSDKPLLTFYEWGGPALTYGYFVDPDDFLVKNSFQMGRRPTGGGILFHTIDCAFSLIIPSGHEKLSINTLDNYRLVNGLIKDALNSLGFKVELLETGCSNLRFCMAKPTVYDLVIEGKKGVGAAQRRSKEGLLHQGSIAMRLPGPKEKAALKDDRLYELMCKETYPIDVDLLRLKKAITDSIKDNL
ncbi:MAG: lipoyl protein ligase domain-containing protein [Parachlamydiaceae bacterium]